MKKIYTKTGDKGETSLFGGRRVSKADLRVETYGTIDELNSVIGVAISEIQNPSPKADEIQNKLIKIQKDLFEIGLILANPSKKSKTSLEDRILELEKMIDDLSEKLPNLSNFILPGGGITGSLLHLARAVCRRAERKTVELSRKEGIDKSIIAYLNRLSDLLFTMARFINHQERKKEEIYKRIIG